MIGTNKIYHSDCLEVMKQIPDKSIDLALTDPPYNVDRNYNSYNDNLTYKDYKLFCESWFNECLRISKNILITVGTNNLKMWYEIKSPDYLYIWYKSNTMLSSKYCQLAVYEPILFYGELINKPIRDVYNIPIIPQIDAKFHNCPKSINLWKRLVKDFTNENDLILDPFSGSGTTAIACHNLKRNFICIEKDKDYWQKSVERYQKHILQTRLEFKNVI